MSTLRAVDLIKTAAENIEGFTFITGTRLMNNIEADDSSLPICILDRPLTILKSFESGGLLLENFRCTVFFFDKSELEYQFEEHEPIIGRMNLAANQFFVNLNSFTDYVRSITQISGIDPINVLDPNLTGVQFSFELTLYPLDEQVCPTGTFTPPELPPFNRYLTEVAVDGVTITGNGTESDPLVAVSGSGLNSIESTTLDVTIADGVATVDGISGIFSPTISNIINSASVDEISGFYFRSGNVVVGTFKCSVSLDATSNQTSFDFSLPILTDFANRNQLRCTCNLVANLFELVGESVISESKGSISITTTNNGDLLQELTIGYQYLVV